MSYFKTVYMQGDLSTGNSSTTPLNAGAIFTGTAVDILNYGIVYVTTKSNVASADHGLSIQQSSDGTNWDSTDEYTVSANTGKTFAINPSLRYLRVVYTNGGTNQTYFRLQTILKGYSLPSSHSIHDPIVNEDDAQLVKAVIAGEDANGVFRNASVDTTNRLTVVSQPYTFSVAEGAIPNHSALLKFGTRTAVAANTQSLVWEGTNALYTYLTSAEQLKVSSSDADDNSTGTGARTLYIDGLDANYDQINETITMTGASVVTTTKSFLRVFRSYVVTCGTSLTNEGTITITNNAGTVQLLVINPNDGQTLMTLWTVPDSHRLFLTQATFSTDSNKGSRISIFTRQNDGGILYPWRIRYRAYAFSGNETFLFQIPFSVPARTDIEIRLTTPASAGTTSCGATFEGWYELV